MKYSVVIVEDHILFSQALEGLVNKFPRFKVLYSCKNGKELFINLKRTKRVPDIVLMDIDLSVIKGIETTTKLREQYPKINVLAISRIENKKVILKMLHAGAKGFLPKYTEKCILERALTEVQETGFFHTRDITNLLIESLHPRKKKEVELKDREIEFVIHACTEKTYKEIARDMCVSPKTIEGYRDAIFEKLNLKNRTGMVIYAIRNNIFHP
ncbi:response regulator transcription factor [Aquimarina sp. 2201CG5-10]|uniref:response regulator transcription factor n=1 Tax=Aquimarina callyspongiae TaxID=3098150 RepID=UPI002AB35885|nr:response regulator transcription factor [Aquimarina sp. 2201CG5-10]MDY8134948.1 response regulator transcription factor [Aquimarina sp. 2201CG5-10]